MSKELTDEKIRAGQGAMRDMITALRNTGGFDQLSNEQLTVIANIVCHATQAVVYPAQFNEQLEEIQIHVLAHTTDETVEAIRELLKSPTAEELMVPNGETLH